MPAASPHPVRRRRRASGYGFRRVAAWGSAVIRLRQAAMKPAARCRAAPCAAPRSPADAFPDRRRGTRGWPKSPRPNWMPSTSTLPAITSNVFQAPGGNPAATSDSTSPAEPVAVRQRHGDAGGAAKTVADDDRLRDSPPSSNTLARRSPIAFDPRRQAFRPGETRQVDQRRPEALRQPRQHWRKRGPVGQQRMDDQQVGPCTTCCDGQRTLAKVTGVDSFSRSSEISGHQRATGRHAEPPILGGRTE